MIGVLIALGCIAIRRICFCCLGLYAAAFVCMEIMKQYLLSIKVMVMAVKSTNGINEVL